jgi:hypothetical protein
MNIATVLLWWGLLGAIPWQIIVLRPKARDNPDGAITVLDCLKALPFGPFVWLAYVGTIILIKLNTSRKSNHTGG